MVQTNCRVVSESATIAISQVILLKNVLNREFRLMLVFIITATALQIFGTSPVDVVPRLL